jgi:predicted Zn-dependent peptidase/outer membrane lipoprotein-sorting protein
MSRLAFALWILLLLSQAALGQKIDRTKKPEAGPAPAASFPDFKEAVLSNGLKVFIIESDRKPTITVRLLVKAGDFFDGEKPGVADFTAELLGRGSPKRKASDFAREADKIGAEYSASSGDDATSIVISGLTKHTDKLLELLSDAVLNPTFPEEQLEIVRKQALSNITAGKKTPQTLAANLQRKVLFGDYPYGKVQTEESVNAITVEDLKNFYNSHYFANNATIAVVGDVKADEITKKLEKYFGKWKRGTPAKVQPAELPDSKGLMIHLVDLPGAVQSNIRVCFRSVPRNNPDLVELGVVESVLGGGFSGRLFQNLREKHGWTYGAYASGVYQRYLGYFAASTEVRNAVTDSAIAEILAEMRRICSEPINEEELKLQREYLAGNYLLSLERAEQNAARLQNIEFYGLPADYYKTYAQRVSRVTPEKALELAKKYIEVSDLAIVVVGDAKEIKPKLEKLAKVRVYDTELNPMISLTLDLSGEELLKKHIEAIGGESAVMKIKDRVIEGKVSIFAGPQTIEGTFKRTEKFPNKQVFIISTPVFSQEVYNDGKRVVQSGMGGTRELTGDELKKAQESAHFNMLYRTAELGYKVTAKEKKMLKGRPVYVAELEQALNGKTILVFDAEDFMLISETRKQTTPQGEIDVTTTYSDFKPVDGVMQPFKIVQSLGMADVQLVVTSIKQNVGVPDEEFVKK